MRVTPPKGMRGSMFAVTKICYHIITPLVSAHNLQKRNFRHQYTCMYQLSEYGLVYLLKNTAVLKYSLQHF